MQLFSQKPKQKHATVLELARENVYKPKARDAFCFFYLAFDLLKKQPVNMNG